ncbi:MAG: GNAT family N-acetyltransferase [Thiohalospira sp.]
MIIINKIPDDLIPEIRNLFRDHLHYDLMVEAILEGQTGQKIKIKLDNDISPKTVQLIRYGFTIFAGDTQTQAAKEMMENLPTNYFIMPSGQKWFELAKSIYNDRLKSRTRYSFSSKEILQENIELMIESHPQKDICRLITLDEAQEMANHKINKLHLMNFNSPEHFIREGFGYRVSKEGEIVAACTTTLVYSKGVEVNVITLPEYRQKGYAFLCALKFLRHCLQNNLYANWDASDEMSVDLAKKLGYSMTEEYNVYYID